MSRRGAQIVGVALVVIGGMLVSCAGTGSDTSAIGPAVSTTIDEAASLSSTEAPESEEPDGTITVVLDDLEGATGLVADAWVLPVNPTGEKEALGGASFSIGSDPFSDSDVVHPLGSRYFDIVDGESAVFEPGTYRFIVEAYVSSGPMRYGCEMPIQVIAGEPLIVTLSTMPAYTGGGWHWTPGAELQYPDCPS